MALGVSPLQDVPLTGVHYELHLGIRVIHIRWPWGCRPSKMFLSRVCFASALPMLPMALGVSPLQDVPLIGSISALFFFYGFFLVAFTELRCYIFFYHDKYESFSF
ncbi:hypothetical protein BDC45DRAFT_522552 [Circinella umbellata]|nr:hypothetical protein BDC45DRAFT_522552 [Circinella umbellata]